MDCIDFKGVVLSYKKIGVGDKVIIMFHGYGQDSSVWEKHATLIGDTYTSYLIDIFYHGKSRWNTELQLNQDFWLHLFLRFIEKNKLSTFELIGYSLGAKFVLLTYLTFPSRIEKIQLIAPDGFGSSIWYDLMTLNKFTLLIFKFLLNNWQFFRLFPVFFYKCRLMSRSLFLFVLRNMDSDQKRITLFNVWSTFRFIHFSISDLSQLIRKRKTPLIVFVGINDEIIKTRKILRFLKKCKQYEFFEIKADHATVFNRVLKDFT